MEESRSARKRRAILAAATEAFLESGYLGANMDDVAARSGVSKQTVYKHFSDKETLFLQIVTSTADDASDRVHGAPPAIDARGDAAEVLREIADRQLALVVQPRMMRLRRLVIGEVGRFPQIGKIFYERGPRRAVAALAATLTRLAERGLVAIEDPLAAAEQLNWMIMAAPLNQAMLLGDGAIPGPAALRRHAAEAVRLFLAAYGRRAPSPRPRPR